jgi:hypothetical protein
MPDDIIHTDRGVTMPEGARTPTPKIAEPRVSKERYHRDILTARKEGEQEGLEKGRREILDWLEIQYTGPKAPARGSIEGKKTEQDERNKRFRRGVSR